MPEPFDFIFSRQIFRSAIRSLKLVRASSSRNFFTSRGHGPNQPALGGFGIVTIAAGHCTDWRAMAALLAAFGDKTLVPLSVGKLFSF